MALAPRTAAGSHHRSTNHTPNTKESQLARTLGVSQAQVSRIEHQADLYLSTLQSYLDAMGGRLELVGIFDNETRVTLTLGDMTGENEQSATPVEPVSAS